MEFLAAPTTPTRKPRKSLSGTGSSISPVRAALQNSNQQGGHSPVPARVTSKAAGTGSTPAAGGENGGGMVRPIAGFGEERAGFENIMGMGSPQTTSSHLRNSASKNTTSVDRCIPNRANIDFDYCHNMLLKSITAQPENEKESKSNPNSPKPNPNNRSDMLSILQPVSRSRLVDCFETGPYSPTRTAVLKDPLKTSITESQSSNSSPQKPGSTRVLPTTASRILDAPNILDDYYLNLLHWGSNNVVAVALRQSVYLWYPDDSRVDSLLTLDGADDFVTSVQWSRADPNVIAVGTNRSKVQLWDASTLQLVREMQGHSDRVSSLAWNGRSVSSGSRDSLILNHDPRERRNVSARYVGHTLEVCGLAWSPCGSTLASGGNENLLCLWDPVMGRNQDTDSNGGRLGGLQTVNDHQPRFKINEHQAAVKALSWCPWQKNTLASGGGTADRSIRIWNAANGTNIKTVDTGSQVCSIQWSDHYKELVSSHGFSDNQLILWKYPTMTKVKDFRGHTSRVLHLAKSPDGRTLCSASADETLRFWDIFSSTKQSGLMHSQPGSPKPMGPMLLGSGMGAGMSVR